MIEIGPNLKEVIVGALCILPIIALIYFFFKSIN